MSKMPEKKLSEKERIDAVIKANPDLGIVEAMVKTGVDYVEIDEDEDEVKKRVRGVGESEVALGSGRGATTLRNAQSATSSEEL